MSELTLMPIRYLLLWFANCIFVWTLAERLFNKKPPGLSPSEWVRWSPDGPAWTASTLVAIPLAVLEVMAYYRYF